uniref:Core shell protein Gag P30 domain-containing protein n=1 Tax=Phasianus colchicus TaxID=9054 RepID=A0A669Q395_PHACC
MGGKQSKGIVKQSPLGCVLAHWRDIGGPPGGNINKKTLIKYCNQCWPSYKLESQERWPFNGTLNYKTMLELMLFLRREGKWDEVPYADMFFTLRNHPEWQKGCRINWAPQRPLVLALEKEQKRPNGTLKQCCSACSIGEKCLRNGGGKERLEDDVSPQAEKQKGFSDEEEQEAKADRKEAGAAGGGSQITTRNGSKKEPVILAPLMQVVGPKGPVKIKAPFSTSDLDSWKEAVKSYGNDPSGVAKRFELIVKNQDLNWRDIDIMLDFMSEPEKQLVLRSAQTQVQARIIAGALWGRLEQYIPLEDPKWNPNDPAEYQLLKQYREWIKLGLENAIPLPAANWSAVYAVKQGQTETPTEFLDNLRSAMRKYTLLDPSSDSGQRMLASLFLSQSSEDIRKELQRLKASELMGLDKLIEEAWRVYRNRDRKERKKLRRRIALEHDVGTQRPPQGRGRGGSGRVQEGFHPPLDQNQCANCREMGHWWRSCPRLRGRNHP